MPSQAGENAANETVCPPPSRSGGHSLSSAARREGDPVTLTITNRETMRMFDGMVVEFKVLDAYDGETTLEDTVASAIGQGAPNAGM